GSGSSVIAFATRNEEQIADKLVELFAEEGTQARARSTSADNGGAWVSREPVQWRTSIQDFRSKE
ncbi:MAG: hypothetical protein ACRD4I_01655, partial [Candidatus Angelobacter sp.]